MNGLISIYWRTPRAQQGQIAATHHPQVSGCAEGVEGPARGLRLRTDSSNGSWTVSRGRRTLFAGTGVAPSVTEVIASLKATKS